MSGPAPRSLLAGFADEVALVAAAAALAGAGTPAREACTPYPVEALAPLLRPAARDHVPWAALGGGMAGAGGMWLLQAWALRDYPLDLAGRALPDWALLLPPALELGLLGAVLAAFAALLWDAGLPRLHHPLFALRRFEAASHDGFFLHVVVDGATRAAMRARLSALGATSVEEAPR